MPMRTKYLFVVSMDVDPNKEDLFDEVYDTEHLPNLLKVPGVRGATRMAGEPIAMSIAGTEKRLAHDGAGYCAIDEIDGPRPHQPRVRQGGGGGALAKSSATLHAQSVSRALQDALAAGRRLCGELLSSAGNAGAIVDRRPPTRPSAAGKPRRGPPSPKASVPAANRRTRSGVICDARRRAARGLCRSSATAGDGLVAARCSRRDRLLQDRVLLALASCELA